MKLLLDTHALLWWPAESPLLGASAGQAIADEHNEIFVSAVSAMEIATKFHAGKLPTAAELIQSFEAIIAAQRFSHLPIQISHSLRAGLLELSHKDPFDRLLIAQALFEDMTLVSNERLFDPTGVTRLW